MKIFITAVLSFACLFCSAQKQLLTFQDLQFIVQNSNTITTDFLQKKDYHLQYSNNDEIRFFGLFADNDYIDIARQSKGKHVTVVLKTTDLEQVEGIQKSLQPYNYKTNKNGKVYRVKDSIISNLAMREEDSGGKANKIYTIELEN